MINAMNDLTNYFSLQDRIEELEAELVKANKKIASVNKMKLRYKARLKLKKVPSRTENALVLIKKLKGTDKPMKLIRLIAKECFMSDGSVRDIWYNAKTHS